MTTLYKDRLVEVTDQEVVFHRYYFPFGTDKRLPLSAIETIEAKPPSLLGGSGRIWGGDLRTWFPLDIARPRRDRLFFASLCLSFRRIGFTVEDSKTFSSVLIGRGLLREQPPV